MPRFLALYTMRHEDFDAFRALPKSEQDAIDGAGVPAWADWEARNAAAIVDRGGMVGKTKRITRDGIADAINPIDGWFCDACRELRWVDQIEWRQFGTTGTRCADRFRAAREQAQAAAAATAEAARPATRARRRKLRAIKKQAAQAAAAVAAERERSTLYNELEDRWLASMGWEDYGSEGFSRPPPELFTFNHKCATQCLGMLSMPAAAARAAAAATTTARSRPL